MFLTLTRWRGWVFDQQFSVLPSALARFPSTTVPLLPSCDEVGLDSVPPLSSVGRMRMMVEMASLHPRYSVISFSCPSFGSHYAQAQAQGLRRQRRAMRQTSQLLAGVIGPVCLRGWPCSPVLADLRNYLRTNTSIRNMVSRLSHGLGQSG